MPSKTKKKGSVVRNLRRLVCGVVVSDRMDKTVTVRVERLVPHPAFGKTLRKSYVCYAHDEKREARRGDKVELMETRPLSKTKHWRLLRVIEKAAATPELDAREAARPEVKAPDATPSVPVA